MIRFISIYLILTIITIPLTAKELFSEEEQQSPPLGGFDERGWALLVEIGNYEEIPELNLGLQSAKRMKTALQQEGGYRPEHIELLIDTTYEGIRNALSRFRKKMKQGDSLLFYFRGYATTAGGGSYFWTSEVTPESFPHYFLSDRELNGWLKSLPTQNTIIILEHYYPQNIPDKSDIGSKATFEGIEYDNRAKIIISHSGQTSTTDKSLVSKLADASQYELIDKDNNRVIVAGEVCEFLKQHAKDPNQVQLQRNPDIIFAKLVSTLNVEANVEEASVFLNDEEIGDTPLNNFKLRSRSNNVRIEKKLYLSEPKERVFETQPRGMTENVTFTLNPVQVRGETLNVNGKPVANVDVSIGTSYQGQTDSRGIFYFDILEESPLEVGERYEVVAQRDEWHRKFTKPFTFLKEGNDLGNIISYSDNSIQLKEARLLADNPYIGEQITGEMKISGMALPIQEITVTLKTPLEDETVSLSDNDLQFDKSQGAYTFNYPIKNDDQLAGYWEILEIVAIDQLMKKATFDVTKVIGVSQRRIKIKIPLVSLLWGIVLRAPTLIFLAVLITATIVLAVIFRRPSQVFEIPYIVGLPVRDGNMFYGRQDVLDSIRSWLNSPNRSAPMILYGARRIGKTSILLQIQSAFRNKKLLPIFIDMQDMLNANLKVVLSNVANSIYDKLEDSQKEKLDPFLKQIDDSNGNAEGDFENFLDKVVKATSCNHILLLIDEYEPLYANESNVSKDIPRYLNHLIRNRIDLSFIFAGVHSLEELGEIEVSLTNKIYKISTLSKESATDLVTKPVEGKFDYENRVVEKILQFTACQPLLIQHLCFQIIERLMEEERRIATLEDLDRAIKETENNPLPYFNELWQELKTQEKIVLSTLAELTSEEAEFTDSFSVENKMREHGILIDAKGILTELYEMSQKGELLEQNPDSDSYRYKIHFIRHWIHNTYPLRQILKNPYTNRGRIENPSQFYDLSFTITLSEIYKESYLISPFLNTFTAIKLEPLTEEETRQLIIEPADGEVEMNEADIQLVFNLSKGHPLLTQIACFYLFGYKKVKETLEKEDYEKVKSEFLREKAKYPELDDWDSISNNQ